MEEELDADGAPGRDDGTGRAGGTVPAHHLLRAVRVDRVDLHVVVVALVLPARQGYVHTFIYI